MWRYAIIFLVLALVAAVFGFGGFPSASQSIARILFFLLLVLFVVTVLASSMNGRRGSGG